MSDRPDGEETIRVPRWVLAFVVPAVGVFLAVARTEHRTNENENKLDQLRMQVETNARDIRTLEMRASWLCTQRTRDDLESGRESAGVCP